MICYVHVKNYLKLIVYLFCVSVLEVTIGEYGISVDKLIEAVANNPTEKKDALPALKSTLDGKCLN